MKKGFVVSAVLYPLLIIAIALIMSVIAMSDNRRKILDNLKLEVTEESETDPEMTNSALYYKMLALEEAYAELNARVSEERIELLNLEGYPVGSLYISTTNKNPSTFLGGEWESYGEGRTLIGAGSGTDSNSTSKTFTAGSTGGEYSHAITTAELPSHTHSIPSLTGTAATKSLVGAFWNVVYQDLTYFGSANGIVSTGNGGAAQGGWVKGVTAFSDKVEGFTINATHNHTVTTNASTTGSAGSSSKTNIVQPYITVYFWKRIA